MGDQRLDFIVGQLVAIRFHFLFPFIDDALLDGLDRLVVLQLFLHLGVGVVFDAAFPCRRDRGTSGNSFPSFP